MLRKILSDIRQSADVSRLFVSLGYVRANEPFAHDARIVATWRAFKVIAADADDPHARAHSLAKSLASSSTRGLAVCTQDNELVITAPRIGQPGTTKSLTVSLRDPSSFSIEQLRRLRPDPASNALSHSLAVADVLQSEAVGEHFFCAFRTALEHMVGAMRKRGSYADRRLIALLTLTRVLFLYFVQSKGWLDGRQQYLRGLLDDALGKQRHFHRSALHPLFFGTLNRPRHLRSPKPELGVIPYLNGGLFQAHAVENRIGPIAFDNGLWRDTFDNLFERFQFCTREANDTNMIAPDTLGRVFERLMDASERRQTGTFFTPETVVREVVEATIETALTERLSRAAAQRVVQLRPQPGEECESARHALARFTILDPAVGSGAFLLGALDTLCDIWMALDRATGIEVSPLTVRRDILRSVLFGVDLNPIAVRLAELRLWLAVIADDPAKDAAAIMPLPNLDGVVRQGDTLLDPLGAARRFGLDLLTVSESEIGTAQATRTRLFDARGPMHRTVQERLRKSELILARQFLDRAIEKAGSAMKDLVAAARARDLFGKRAGLSSLQDQRYREWQRLRREAKRARRELDDAKLPFFSFEVHTPDIMRDGGFSAVVGNPPWVRSEALAPAVKSALKERFRWWQAPQGKGFGHLPDLAVAFLERALELTRPGGVVGFLVPSKITSAGYGEAARRNLVRDTSIAYLHRVADRNATFGATTYPLAIVVRKSKPPPKHTLRLGLTGSERITQAALKPPGPWILVPDHVQTALREFRDSGIKLGEIAPPTLGVKTGADRVFVGKPLRATRSTIVARFDGKEIEVETAIVRPAIRGRDIRAFAIQQSHILLWGHDHRAKPLSRLPPKAQSYFQSHEDRLRRRHDYRDGPIWSVFRIRGVLAQNPIVWRDLARRPTAVALKETPHVMAIPLNTCYVADAPDREVALVAAAVMNSTWTAAYTWAAADEARGGYRRINAAVAAQFPLPSPGPPRAALAALSAMAHGEDTQVSPSQIDEAVALALGLSRRTQTALRTLAANHRRGTQTD